MSLAFALVVGILFGTGVFLLLKPDVFRVIAGLVLVSHAANLTLMGSGLSRGQAPILPAAGAEPIADPLVQAMTLTALVIGFAVTALLLALAYSVFRLRDSVDLDELSQEEATKSEKSEARRRPLDEERELQSRAEAQTYDEAVR